MRLQPPGLARQRSTCTLSWVDGRGRGVGLRGGNGVDPDKHASFSALTVVFIDGRAFHCCLSFSLLALVSASATISARDAISKVGCRFPALAPVSLLTAVFQIDCCFSHRLLFSCRLLFFRSTAVFQAQVIFRVDCRLTVDLHFGGSMSGFSNNCRFHARCHFPCRVLFSTLTAGSSADRRFQRWLLTSVAGVVSSVDCPFRRRLLSSILAVVSGVDCRFQGSVSKSAWTAFLVPNVQVSEHRFHAN